MKNRSWNSHRRSLESFAATSVSVLGSFAITSLESKEDNQENDSRKLHYPILSTGNRRDLSREKRLSACLLAQILAFTIMRLLYIRVFYFLLRQTDGYFLYGYSNRLNIRLARDKNNENLWTWNKILLNDSRESLINSHVSFLQMKKNNIALYISLYILYILYRSEFFFRSFSSIIKNKFKPVFNI